MIFVSAQMCLVSGNLPVDCSFSVVVNLLRVFLVQEPQLEWILLLHNTISSVASKINLMFKTEFSYKSVY